MSEKEASQKGLVFFEKDDAVKKVDTVSFSSFRFFFYVTSKICFEPI
jgi:hypothetical protein